MLTITKTYSCGHNHVRTIESQTSNNEEITSALPCHFCAGEQAPRSFTAHTFSCSLCLRSVLASELIDRLLRDTRDGWMSDIEIARSMDYCLECSTGNDSPNEQQQAAINGVL